MIVHETVLRMTEPVQPVKLLRDIVTLAERRQFDAAENLASLAAKQYPRSAAAWFLLTHIRLQRNNITGAREAVRQGLSVAPADKNLHFLSIDLAERAGEIASAMADLRVLAADAERNGSLLRQIGQLFTRLGRHEEAEQCYRRALETAPGNPDFLYDLTIPLVAGGKMEETEDLLDQVIAAKPQHYNAHFVRATLRKQTPSRNHVAELEALLARPFVDAMGEVHLRYAMAKELEDLGEHRRSFAALQRGANARRRMLSYRVEDDARAMEKIAQVFDADFFARDIPGQSGPKPIFILGLPRSGSTLVDRILGSHSQVESLGEPGAFGYAVTKAVPQGGSSLDLIAKSAEVDFAYVGKDYVQMTRALAKGAPRAIDKTPINFIYLGLIARALPDATIIHTRRNAMDVCYAMYKMLFQNGYPFSYSLSDLGRYYLAYRKLMAHWSAALPRRFIEVQYEDVVARQESATRQLVAACGLDWEDACLAPERNAAPSLTASTAQIRQKVYNSSVGLWRAYEEELRPLIRILRDGGVEIEGT